MNSTELAAACGFAPAAGEGARQVQGIFAGDLLSWAMGRAKELGLSPEEIGVAFKSVNWGGGDALA